MGGYAREPVHVLCLAARDTRVQGLDFIDATALDVYRDAGYEMHLGYYEEIAPEALHRYPVVVGMIGQLHQGTRAINDELAAGIDAYVRAGGGFVLLPGPSYYGVADFTDQLNPVLAPYGAELLNEIPLDPERQLESTQVLAYRYLRTTNLLAHPVTAGIDELLLPLDYADSYVRTHTMRVSDDWEVLVRGESTTASYPFGRTGPNAEPGTWPSSPPFLAVRSWGRGRIAIFTTASRYFIWDAYHRAHGSGLVLERGGLDLMRHLFAFVSAAGYAQDVPASAGTDTVDAVPGNVPVAVDKNDWLETVLRSHRPPGSRVHAYIDCGAVADRPYRSEVGRGYLDSHPGAIARWPGAVRFHVTAANARLVTGSSLRYRFDGLVSDEGYHLGFMLWDYSGSAGRGVRIAFGDRAINRDWMSPRFAEEQGPRFESVPVPAGAVSNGSLVVSFSLAGAGEAKVAALGELWLFGPGADDDESGEALRARCEPPGGDPDRLFRPTPVYHGLIGARSPHGGGEASVADMAEAGRRAGLDFLVFTDPVSGLSSEGYDALVRDCRAVSSTNFIALPGIRFQDRFAEPSAGADRRRGKGAISAYSFQAIDRLPEPDDFGNPHALLWKFLGGAFSGGKNATATLRHPQRNTLSPFFQRFWRGFDVQTFDRGGNALDDARGLYRDLLAAGYGPYPRVSGDYHTPAEIRAAAGGWHTLIHAARLERIGPFHYASMVSNGPRIERYAFTSDHTLNGESGGGLVFRDQARVYLHLEASHEVPIATVTLYFNNAVVRRWHPQSRRFSIVEPVLVTAEGELMTHIEADDGSEAFSGRFRLVDHTFYCSMCGDNQNTISSLTRIPSRFVYDEREIYMQHSNWHTGQGAGQLGVLTDARELVPRIIETGIIQPCKYFKPAPLIRFHDGHSEDHEESELRIRSSSGDHHEISYDFDAPGNSFRSRTTLSVYRPAENGATATLVESELTAIRDIPADEIDGIRLLSLAMMPSLPPGWHYTCTDSEGTLLSRDFAAIPPGTRQRVALKPGTPLMIWPSEAGNIVVIPLGKTHLDAAFTNLEGVWNGREHVELELPGRAFAAGETQRSAYLVMLWPGSITSPDQLLPLAARYTDSAAVTDLSPDATAQSGYRVRLAGRHGAAATLTMTVPRRDPLPLSVDGVNARWTCGLEVDGTMRLAPSGKDPMHTVVDAPGQVCRVAVGNLLTADHPGLVVDWGARGPAGLHFYAHNPLSETITTTVRSNPVFDSLPEVATDVSLVPGEGRWFLAQPVSTP